jgi:PAS domain S-box-containing protein
VRSTSEPSGDARAGRLAQALAELAEVQFALELERHGRTETQALFDLILEAMSDAIVVVDAPGRITRVNAAAVRLTGRAAEDLVGDLAAELFEEGFPVSPWEILERSPDGRLPALEAHVRSVHRGPVPVSMSCSVLRAPSGQVVGEVYVARDLSETERLLHELEEAEARWRLLAELADLLGREVDPRKSLLAVCRWLAESLGMSVAVVLAGDLTVDSAEAWPEQGAAAGDLQALVGRPPERGSALGTVLRDSRSVHAENLRPGFPLLRAAAAPDDVRSAAIVPLVARHGCLGAVLVFGGESGQVSARVLSVVEGVAGRIALAVANAQLREQLSHFEAAEEAARFREELLAGVSHDMETPLAVLLGSLSALQSGERINPQHRTRLYHGMARQAEQLHRLVQQFLDYSRVEAGRPVTLRTRVTDVGKVIARVQASSAGGRRLMVDVPDNLPPAFADPDRLDQVLANLVSNAIKFSPAGTPIGIAAWAEDDVIEVTVTDQGAGMSPADLARAFEKFYRGSAASNVPGTGLGLYISRVLMEAQGGRITVTSRPGEGSRFAVVVPRAGDMAPGG